MGIKGSINELDHMTKMATMLICDAFCDFGTCCGTTSSSENVILIDVTN